MSRVSFGLPAELQDYVVKVGTRPNPHRAALRDATNALENASMQISEEQGNFMYLLIKMIGARKCLEVGTFTGYSALVTAEALPAVGQLICCDISSEYSAIWRPHWETAGVASKHDLRSGPATELRETFLPSGHGGTCDFAFIVSEKPNFDG